MFPPLKIAKLLSMLLIFLTASACQEKRGVKIGDTAPAISGLDVRGTPVNSSTLKGKTVVVYFWTGSCCGENLKQLQPFYSRNKHRGFEIIAVNEIDSRDKILSYAADNGVTFPMLSDDRYMLFNAYNVVGFPTIIVLDKKGIVREKVLGDMKTANLQNLIAPHI